MGREHRIISALYETDVPVAKTYGLCEDAEVNGSSFYLMEYIEGIVPHTVEPMQTLTMSERQSFGADVIRVLSTLHLINPDDVGLGQLGRKEGLHRTTAQTMDAAVGGHKNTRNSRHG